MRAAPPVDDVGVLVALVTFAFGEDGALFVGVAVDEDVPEADEEAEEADEEAADAPLCVAVWLVQLGCEVAETVLFGVVVELGSLLGSSPDDDVPVVVGLGLLLDDGVPVVVGLGLGLLLAPVLEVAVPPLLWLEPDEVAGAGVVWVDLLAEPVVLCVADGCAEDEDEAQGVELPTGCGLGLLAEAPGVSGGALLWPLVPLPLFEEVPLVRAATAAS